MGRRDSRSPSRSRKRRRDSRSRSPPRKRGRDDDRRGGGRGGDRGGNRGEVDLAAFGDRGTIVGLRPAGFGFIRPATGQVDGMDLYFHAKECNKESPFDEMRQDDEVTYNAVQGDRSGKP